MDNENKQKFLKYTSTDSSGVRTRMRVGKRCELMREKTGKCIVVGSNARRKRMLLGM
jgi:hypothetical protein